MVPRDPAPAVAEAMPLSAEDRRALLHVARAALAEYFGIEPAPAWPDSAALRARRASFVTLTRRDTGALRGCRGEIEARRPLAQSVARMVVASATDDPRFPPVTAGELPRLRIAINALTPLRPIRVQDVVIGRHGLMLEVGGRSGLLLPDVAVHQHWDLAALLSALCRKAGVPDGAWRRSDAGIRGFEAETWSEA